MQKILLVGSNPADVNAFANLISGTFPIFEITVAQTAQEGFVAVKKDNPDIIFLFEKIQDSERLDFCNLFVSEEIKHGQIVFLSNRKLAENYREEASNLGVDAFITLPTDRQEISLLVKILQKIISANKKNEVNNTGIKSTNPDELFYKIFEYHNAVKLIIDPEDGQIIDANLAATDYYGWSADQLKRMKISDINIARPEVIQAEMEKARNNKQNYFEFSHRLADGSIRDVEVFSSHIQVKGKLLLHSIVHDVTKRKQVESLLRESEEKLRLINELNSEMLELRGVEDIYELITNKLHSLIPNTIIIYNSINEESNNSKVERIKGVENKLLSQILKLIRFNPLGKTFKLQPKHYNYFRSGKLVEFKGGLAEFSGAELSPLITNNISSLIGLNKIYTIGIKKDENLLSSIHFLTFNGKEINEAGFIEMLVNQAGIILQKKLTENELKISEEKYRRLSENIKDVIWVLDTQTMCFTYVSPSVKLLRGYTPDEIIGKSLKDSVLPGYYERIKEEIKKRCTNFLAGKITSEDYFIREIKQPCKNGQIVTTEVNLYFWENTHTGNIEIHGVSRDITERKKAEQDLQESEARLRRAEVTSKSGNWELHLETQKIIASEGALIIYGISGDIFDYSYTKTVPLPEYRKILDDSLYNLINLGSTYDLEFKIKSANTGEIKNIHSVAYYDPKKKMVFGVIQDITHRKKIEDALSESEERYRLHFENSIEAFLLTSPNGQIQSVNPATCQMFGYSEKEIYNGGQELLIDMSDPRVYEALSERSKTGKFFGELTGLRRDGSKFPMEIATTLFTDRDGNLRSSMIIQDISERKRTEKRLAESEANARAIMESTDDVLLLLDKNGILIDCNEAHAKRLNKTREELLGKCTFDELPPDIAKSRSEAVNLCFSTGECVYREDYRLGRYIEYVVHPIYSENNEVQKVAIFAIDTTKRKQDELILQENEKRLRELNATKDKFFSIIAHDLKGPFNSIIGLSDLLQEQMRVKNYAGIEEYAHIIQKSSLRAILLLTNLLEWSRSQTGRIEFSPEYIDIVPLVNDVVELFEESANQKTITVHRDHPRNLIVFADKAMLSTVLRNLVSNAIKFTQPKGQINIKVRRTEENTEITISDNGIGMNEEELKHLFQIGGINSKLGTRNEKGTGLGLILCKEFVDKHGGEIRVESQIDRGSRFIFTIPQPE